MRTDHLTIACCAECGVTIIIDPAQTERPTAEEQLHQRWHADLREQLRQLQQK